MTNHDSANDDGGSPSGRGARLAGFEPGWGRRLKEARIRAGYKSQPALARAMGVHVMTIYRHEAEKVEPHDDAVRAYSRMLTVSESYLRYGSGDESVPRAVRSYLDSYRSAELLPETRRRLTQIPWALLTAGDVDEKVVDGLARLVDKNLRSRGKFPDDPSRGVPQHSSAISGEPSRPSDEPGCSSSPPRARP